MATTKVVNYATVTVGYQGYVMTMEDAMAVFAAFSRSEKYEQRYNSTLKSTEYVVSPMDPDTVRVAMVSSEGYVMGKMQHKANQLKKENENGDS